MILMNKEGANTYAKRRLFHIKHYKQILSDLANLKWHEIEDGIRKFHPNIIGTTTMTTKYTSALNVAKIVKQFDSSMLVVMGRVLHWKL